MLAIHIVDIKEFMNQLLVSDTFDHFLLTEAVIKTNVTYQIQGRLNQDFYSPDELELLGLDGCEVAPFSMLRPVCFDLIKGRKTPLAFKFTFQLSHSNLERTLQSIHSPFTTADISSVFFHVRYQDQKLMCTTGISYRTFQPDHTLDHEWDSLMQRFLSNHKIPFEVIQ